VLFLVMHSDPFLLLAMASQRGTSAQGEFHMHKNLDGLAGVPFSIGVTGQRALARANKMLSLPLCVQPAERA
jgi:hypothetical protein